jgi:hypothetical protein
MIVSVGNWHDVVPIEIDTIQGGSDISGTLSKLHRCIKKSYFLLILSHKTVLALFRSGNKIKQTRPVPENINQQEAMRAAIVSKLRAGLL